MSATQITVMKFGGTSVGDAVCIERAAEIIAGAQRERAVVAVVSAMSGVTARLIDAARRAATGDESIADELAFFLREKHGRALERLVTNDDRRARLTADVERLISEAVNYCRGAALLAELTPRTLDAISSIGERLAVLLLACALNESGVTGEAIEATALVVTDEEHGCAEPLMKETRERAQARLLPLLEKGCVPVVTGFIGASLKGALTTLGRGGSDYSATILGAALDASEVIIWTDVDGVLTADPRLVPDARMLREISYNEAAELAYFGAKVLHPKTLRPVADAGVPVWIRNSFAPEGTGTKINATGHPTARGVKAITAITDVSLITVGGRGMFGVPGIAARTFTAAATARANVLLISQSSSENDICFVVNSADAEHTIEALRRAFAHDLAHHQVEYISVNNAIAIVAVVGEKMRGMPGLAGRVFGALGDEGVNIIAIAQGSSEYNVSFVVEADAMPRAMSAIHEKFGLARRAPDAETQARMVEGK